MRSKKITDLVEAKAVDVIEEALYIFRRFPQTLFPYYIGSIPFILGLLYFVADLSQNTFARTHLVGWAFIMTCLFIWMKFWQAIFAMEIYGKIYESDYPRRTLGDYGNLIVTQTIIHSSTFIVWPITGCLILPYPWIYAFYQYSSIVPTNLNDPKSLLKGIWKYSTQSPRQNILLIALFMLIYLVCMINIGTVIFFLPQFLKVLFAINTVFVLSVASFFNTTFLATVFGLSYLLVNPVIKAVYVIRYFAGNSRASGDDLKADLVFLKAHAKTALMVSLIILISGTNVFADVNSSENLEPLTEENLNNSMDKILSEREFAWRMPTQEIEAPKDDSALESFFQWTSEIAKNVEETVGRWMDKLGEWLKKRFPSSEPHEQAQVKIGKVSKLVYGLILLLVLALGGILFFIFRIRKRKSQEEPKSQPVVPDINSESIKADDFLIEEWLKLAQEFLAQGQFRSAVRAFYLGTLSHLGRSEMIILKLYKSNRDYELELKRRAYGKKQLCEIFSNTVGVFNTVWYGDKKLEAQDVVEFAKEQETIIQLTNAPIAQ